MHVERLEFSGADANRLAADRFGDRGLPVILLHGGGQTRHSWDAAAERIAAIGHVVYSVDQRGHGQSEWVPSGAYAFADFGADLVELCAAVKTLHGARPVVVGASLGGFAGMLAEGALEPGSMSALVLVDITPRIDPGGVDKIIGFMGERVEDGFASVEEAADAISRYLPGRNKPSDLSGLAKNLRLHADGRYRWHWDPKFLRTKQMETAEERQRVQDRFVEAARNLNLPVLLIRGRNSELVSKAHVDEFLSLVPHARFTDIHGAGHMVAGDRNDVFADAVETFLRELPIAGKTD